MGQRADGRAQDLAVSATAVRRRLHKGGPVTVGVAAHVRELCDALAKLAATVKWQSGVP